MRERGKKILVVDDDIIIRDSLNEFLSILGHDVECAGSGREALKLIREKPYDALLTDHIMPEGDGIELVKKIRDSGMPLFIIGISGSCDESDFVDAGANIFLRKPLELKELLNALESISRSS